MYYFLPLLDSDLNNPLTNTTDQHTNKYAPLPIRLIRLGDL